MNSLQCMLIASNEDMPHNGKAAFRCAYLSVRCCVAKGEWHCGVGSGEGGGHDGRSATEGSDSNHPGHVAGYPHAVEGGWGGAAPAVETKHCGGATPWCLPHWCGLLLPCTCATSSRFHLQLCAMCRSLHWGSLNAPLLGPSTPTSTTT